MTILGKGVSSSCLHSEIIAVENVYFVRIIRSYVRRFVVVFALKDEKFLGAATFFWFCCFSRSVKTSLIELKKNVFAVIIHYFCVQMFTGVLIRSVLNLHFQSLFLSNSARKESTVGEITNLMSVDGQRLMDLVPYLYAVLSCKLLSMCFSSWSLHVTISVLSQGTFARKYSYLKFICKLEKYYNFSEKIIHEFFLTDVKICLHSKFILRLSVY